MKQVLRIILIILAMPVLLFVLIVLLTFIVALCPFGTICFVVWQIKGYLIDKKHLELKAKIKMQPKKTWLEKLQLNEGN